ncbi:LacI family transcriptional regulator [Mycetocola tolaasinivorans]|uniref:LacI family transcriptional regulator n=1 Tax=Mycetocola tolaasinivorans TaxID=76635 RepID=A0A3L7AAV1_9MICO|nr:LacI family DNA-binding transcriptional regulator [Mycetocola tolaasinivorans]RLP77509.1 LacI family transcriptional regulator [Mycetocola tolaasinivorans]
MAHRVTINDVAARSGVAISSVSSALNGRPGVSEATREKILAAAEELGFVPSVRGRSLAGKKTFSVGLVVHRDPDVLELDPFFGGFIGGIESYIDERGFALVLQTSPGASEILERYRRLAAGRRVDGVFLNELEVDDARVPTVQDLGLPAVGIGADDAFPLPSVRQDHRPGIDALVEHLTELGHTHFAFVGGPPRFVHSRQRELAWRESLTARGITPGPVVDGGFTYEGGIAAANALLANRTRPTAVICANDLSAMGFIAQAQHHGFDVPGDLSVAGYDGIQLGSYLRPTLTTIQTSPNQIGFEAARLLLQAIDGEPTVDVNVPAAELVIRHSTGPVPSSN